MKVENLSNDELVNLAELLNQINLDLLDWPLDHLELEAIKHRSKLIRGILLLANGHTADCVDEIQEFYNAVRENEEA